MLGHLGNLLKVGRRLFNKLCACNGGLTGQQKVTRPSHNLAFADLKRLYGNAKFLGNLTDFSGFGGQLLNARKLFKLTKDSLFILNVRRPYCGLKVAHGCPGCVGRGHGHSLGLRQLGYFFFDLTPADRSSNSTGNRAKASTKSGTKTNMSKKLIAKGFRVAQSVFINRSTKTIQCTFNARSNGL